MSVLPLVWQLSQSWVFPTPVCWDSRSLGGQEKRKALLQEVSGGYRWQGIRWAAWQARGGWWRTVSSSGMFPRPDLTMVRVWHDLRQHTLSAWAVPSTNGNHILQWDLNKGLTSSSALTGKMGKLFKIRAFPENPRHAVAILSLWGFCGEHKGRENSVAEF